MTAARMGHHTVLAAQVAGVRKRYSRGDGFSPSEDEAFETVRQIVEGVVKEHRYNPRGL